MINISPSGIVIKQGKRPSIGKKRMLAKISRIVLGGARLALGRKAPLFVSHYVNFRCNLSCSYCGTWKERPKELSTRRIKGIMSEFSDAGTISWNISGGEPLLRKDIGELVSHAKSRGMAVSINTNGTLLSARAGELAGCDLISVSLDGGETLHDKIRGKGVFKKAVSGIKKADLLGIKTSIMAVLSPMTLSDNCREVSEIISLAKSLRVQVAFQPMHADRYNKLSGETDYVPLAFPNKNYLKAVGIIEREKKKNPWLIRMSPDYIAKLKSAKSHSCLAGKNFCIIMPDGRIAPCFVKEGESSRPSASVRNFKKLREYPKCFCHFNCYSEWNFALSLNPKSVPHYFSNYLFMAKGRGKRGD